MHVAVPPPPPLHSIRSDAYFTITSPVHYVNDQRLTQVVLLECCSKYHNTDLLIGSVRSVYCDMTEVSVSSSLTILHCTNVKKINSVTLRYENGWPVSAGAAVKGP